MVKKSNDTVGVLVARFQTPVLLEGHREVLDKFFAIPHFKHFIVLGVPATKATKCNPFDFNARRGMLQKAYGESISVMYLKDCNDDDVWSRQLDELIWSNNNGLDTIIYGTEESVTGKYHGIHKVVKLETTAYTNWQEYCRKAGRAKYDLESWMQGVAWATQNRYPTAFPTVDCAIFDDESYSKMWMARKPLEPYYRFVGGFVDPTLDDSYEDAAIRESKEETCMDCTVVRSLGTFKIDDWRYRYEEDKIITTLFLMVRRGGVPKPCDDVEEIRLIDMKSLPKDFQVMPEHLAMFEKVVCLANGKSGKTEFTL